VLDSGRIVAEERITADRGDRVAVSRGLRDTLLGHLGVERDGGGVVHLARARA
jgi:sulfonate transport system ATP-binding protein